MTTNKQVTIMYFTDILCIWAYLAQIRMDELQEKFSNNIDIQHHFIPVFGSVKSKMIDNWGNQGGVGAYSTHVQEIANKFDHIQVHPDIWTKHTPTTSTSCHLFLKAIQILEARKELPDISTQNNVNRNALETIAWAFRVSFFKNLVDVSNVKNQMEIGENFKLPLGKIQKLIESGDAFAALDADLQLKEKHNIAGSPTLVLNEGRQIIYGNVGYRVIEANIQELLNQPESQASWC